MNEGRILVVGGAYGSGKSEISLNLAEQVAGTGERVILVDLDFVNPYFRSRELKGRLGSSVEVISTAEGYESADLPAISGQIAATIRLGKERLIIDLGGDPVGAKILRSFAGEPQLGDADFWLVINPYRPFTAKSDQMVQMVEALSQSAGLKPTGIIANPNLLEETTAEVIRNGFAEVRQAARVLGLPVKLLVIEKGLLPVNPRTLTVDPAVQILPLNRHLWPPWGT